MALASSRLVLELARLRSAPTSFAILPISNQSNWRISRRFFPVSSAGYRLPAKSQREARGHDSDRRFESHLEMLISNIPDPVRAITHDNSDAGPVPAASMVGFGIRFKALERPPTATKKKIAESPL